VAPPPEEAAWNAGLYLDWKRNHVEDKLRAYWRKHGRPPPRR
jgi:hypothetical protein